MCTRQDGTCFIKTPGKEIPCFIGEIFIGSFYPTFAGVSHGGPSSGALPLIENLCRDVVPQSAFGGTGRELGLRQRQTPIAGSTGVSLCCGHNGTLHRLLPRSVTLVFSRASFYHFANTLIERLCRHPTVIKCLWISSRLPDRGSPAIGIAVGRWEF